MEKGPPLLQSQNPRLTVGGCSFQFRQRQRCIFSFFLGEGLTCNYLIIVRDCHQQKQRPDYESKSNEDKQLKISWRVDRRSAASAAMYGCSRPSTSESQFLDLFENAQYKSETFTTWEDD